MALVGSIRVGTISGLVDSLRRTNVQAGLTLRSGEDEGTISFKQGELEDCTMDVLDGADALDEMLTWTHGQFTLRIIDADTDADSGDLASQRPHVMVVDDELGVRKLIESFLEAEGYRVSVVSQASQAVNLVEYCRPDVVLLDVMLTGIDGFELADLLRQQYDQRTLPILMMSANHDFKERADQRGFSFFGKPFDFKRLCKRIDELVGVPADRAIADRLRATDPASGPAARAASGPASGPGARAASGLASGPGARTASGPGARTASSLSSGPGARPATATTGSPPDLISRSEQRSGPRSRFGARTDSARASGELDGLTLPVKLATLLNAEAFLPDLDQCYVLDDVAQARFALAQTDPSLAALVAGFDGFQTLRQWLAEDPDQREARVMVTLLLLAVDALRTAEAAFGT